MSDLPDLDTSEISFVAWYNVIDDGGLDSLDPENLISHPDIKEYTLYDNGWEGVFEMENGRDADVRAKSDGYIVAYLDRSESYGQDVDRSDITGPWDVLNDWTDSYNLTNELGENELANSIHSLIGELDNSDDIPSYGDFGSWSEDAGLYDYSHGDHEGWAIFSFQDTSEIDGTYGFLHTDVTIDGAVIVASIDRKDIGYSANVTWDPDDESITLASEGDDGSAFGNLDLTSRIESGDVEYESEFHDGSSVGNGMSVDVLIWYRSE